MFFKGRNNCRQKSVATVHFHQVFRPHFLPPFNLIPKNPQPVCKISLKLRAKKLNFWLIRGRLWFIQNICLVNDIIKIDKREKFANFSICGCKVNFFQRFGSRFIIHEIVIFGQFLGVIPQKYGPVLSNFQPEVVLQQTKSLFQIFFEEFKFLWKRDRYFF